MKRFYPAIPFVLIVVILEIAVRRGWIAPYLMAPPSGIWRALLENSAKLGRAFFSTMVAASLGFALSLGIGLAAGIALASSKTLEKIFYPYAVFFQTVPIISIAPLLVIWFGYGAPTVVASTFICSVFPIVANSLTGLKSTDPLLIDLFRLYGARPSYLLMKLRFPSALPNILTGARIASGLAIIGAIVGEFIGGGGLGGIVDEARLQQKTELVFAAVLLSALLGWLFFGLISLFSHLLLRRWHPSEKKGA